MSRQVFLSQRQAIIANDSIAIIANDVNGVTPDNVNYIDKQRSMTLLHTACYYDRPHCVNMLLRCGADVNLSTDDGFTALHWAAMLGHRECVMLLLSEKGVNVNPVSVSGWTPLARAFSRLTPAGQKNASVEIERSGETGRPSTAEDDHFAASAASAASARPTTATLKEPTTATLKEDGGLPLSGHQSCISLLLQSRASIDSVTEKLGNIKVSWVGPTSLAITY